MMDGDGLTNVLWLERKSRPWGMEKSGLVTLIQYLDSSDEGKGFVQFSVLVVILSLWNPNYGHYCDLLWASQVALVGKNLPANEGDTRDVGSIPGQEDPLEEGMATHFSILAWRMPWTEEPGSLQSMGSHSVGHDWSDLAAAWPVQTCGQLGTHWNIGFCRPSVNLL